MDTVSPLATSAVTTILGTGVSQKARELQMLPSQTDTQQIPEAGSQPARDVNQVAAGAQSDSGKGDNTGLAETELTDTETSPPPPQLALGTVNSIYSEPVYNKVLVIRNNFYSPDPFS